MPDSLNAASEEDVRTKIRDYLTRVSRRPDLPDDHDIFGSGIVNSLFAVEIVCFIEENFGLTVENEDLNVANFCSVNALVRFVDRKISGS